MPASQCSTNTGGHLNAQSRATGSSCSSRCSSTSSPRDHRATILAGSNSSDGDPGQHPQNSTSAGPPRLYPPLLVSRGRGKKTGIRQRLPSAKEQGERTPLQMPLRELQQPPIQDACGHYHQAPVAYYYQPFSSTDILNWQRHTPPYLGEPQAMITLGNYFSNLPP